MVRHILGDHALRYMDENPILAMRLSDPTKVRIHTANYELTEVERRQAAQQRLPDTRDHRALSGG